MPPVAADLPYRNARWRVDGDPSDWGDGGRRFEVRRPAAPGEPSPALATVRLAWDRESLWALFEVVDPTPVPAPAAARGPELFQWDSVEIYVDGLGDRAARMGADDFQVILAPDGRYTVLQGDPLLLELEALEVPKRERPAFSLEAAGRSAAGGYVVECAIPFAALGLSPSAGAVFAFDLALNDWLADHAAAPQLHFDLETLRKLDGRPGGTSSEYTRNGLEAEPAAALEARLYRPWSLAGSGDFGHPGRWRSLRLSGGPALAERFVEALGPSWTLAGGTVSALLLILATLAVGERRHRRRIAALLERLAGLDALPAAAPALAPREPRLPPVAAAPPEPSSPPPEIVPAPSLPSAHEAPAGAGHQVPPALDWLEHAAEHPPAGAGERFALRALRAIRARLDAPLAPADLADTLCMSLRTLERHLTEELGCSPSELILAEKMRAARHLLVAGGLQVQEVARRVGYDDPAHFSRRFKAYFGAAPKAFAAARERAA